MYKLPKAERSLRCNCEAGHSPNEPLIFPIKKTRFIEPFPCPCAWDNKVCLLPTIMCKECQRPHRLDTMRDNCHSTFLCVWCGQVILNLEREMREHCANCTHRPYPTVFIESDMCKCPKCPYKCSQARPFQECFNTQIIRNNVKYVHPTFPTDPDEITTLENMTPQEIFRYARESTITPHVQKRCPKSFKNWDNCRLGQPPFALPNDFFIPSAFDPEEIAARMSTTVFRKPPSCPYSFE